MLALRIGREVTGADEMALARLYADLLASWDARLLPHFESSRSASWPASFATFRRIMS